LSPQGKGKAKVTSLKIFPGSPKQASKKEKGFREREFLPACCPPKADYGFLPAACGGGQLVMTGFASWIYGLNSAK